MDPNATLAELRAAVRRINGASVEQDVDLAAEALDLAERIEALDEWITKGGFLPDAWQRQRRNAWPDYQLPAAMRYGTPEGE